MHVAPCTNLLLYCFPQPRSESLLMPAEKEQLCFPPTQVGLPIIRSVLRRLRRILAMDFIIPPEREISLRFFFFFLLSVLAFFFFFFCHFSSEVTFSKEGVFPRGGWPGSGQSQQGCVVPSFLEDLCSAPASGTLAAPEMGSRPPAPWSRTLAQTTSSLWSLFAGWVRTSGLEDRRSGFSTLGEHPRQHPSQPPTETGLISHPWLLSPSSAVACDGVYLVLSLLLLYYYYFCICCSAWWKPSGFLEPDGWPSADVWLVSLPCPWHLYILRGPF